MPNTLREMLNLRPTLRPERLRIEVVRPKHSYRKRITNLRFTDCQTGFAARDFTTHFYRLHRVAIIHLF